jgi:hypothetical protein
MLEYYLSKDKLAHSCDKIELYEKIKKYFTNKEEYFSLTKNGKFKFIGTEVFPWTNNFIDLFCDHLIIRI